MPISVVCGSCSAKLMAPDAAAGKRVKCRNCQSVIAVPAIVEAEVESDFEFVDPATVAPAKPVVAAAVPVKAKSKPVVVVDEDEEEDEAPKPKKKSKAAVIDEDDEDEAPRKSKKKAIIADEGEEENESPRKSKKKAIIADEDDEDEAPRKGKKGVKGKKTAKKKMNPLIFVLGGVGALFAVGFLGVMVWYVAIREKGGTAGTNAIPTGTSGPNQQPVTPPVPAGWTRYEKPEFTVAMLDSVGEPEYLHVPGEKDSVIFFSKMPDESKYMGVAVTKMTPAQNAIAVSDPERALDDIEKENGKDGKSKILSRASVMTEIHKGRELKVEEKDGILLLR